jgi:peptidoglycan/xylan/chitin deacetylase (PgdA/CDA1 family)
VIAIPVLLYHSISSRAQPGATRWTVSPREFSLHVETIGSSGRTGLTLAALGACLRGEQVLPPRPVALTFDDGYADVIDAVATLADRALPSTTFVTTGRVGTPGMISRPALADLRRLPLAEVAAHGVHHHRLDELPGARIVDEVQGSKAQLEDLIGAPVTSFAYPHGSYDARVRDAVIAAGYGAAAAVKNALSHSSDDPFAIARWTVTAGTTPRRIGEILEGQGAPLAWRRERLRTRAGRTARRLRRLARGESRAGLR